MSYTLCSNSARLNYKKGNSDVSKAYAIWFNKFLYIRGYSAHSKPNWYTDKTGYKACLIRTVKFTNLSWIYKEFYPQGIKIVPKNIQDWLSPFVLAIWYM